MGKCLLSMEKDDRVQKRRDVSSLDSEICLAVNRITFLGKIKTHLEQFVLKSNNRCLRTRFYIFSVKSALNSAIEKI